VKSFGELVAKRRKELGLTQTEVAQQIIGRHGGPISQERITDIEHNRYGVRAGRFWNSWHVRSSSTLTCCTCGAG
jgi:transcriptional regulator with XRE-family HTH domain